MIRDEEQEFSYLFESRGEIVFFTEWKFQFLLIYGTFLQESTPSDMFYHEFRKHLVPFHSSGTSHRVNYRGITTGTSQPETMMPGQCAVTPQRSISHIGGELGT